MIEAQPLQFSGSPSAIPFLRLPEATLFAARAQRLRQLAQGHAMADYLALIAGVADAQHQALGDFPSPRLPDAAQLALAREHGLPPLSIYSWPRTTDWQHALRRIIEQTAPAMNQATSEIAGRLSQASAEQLEQQAQYLLTSQLEALDLGAAPFVAAALQVYWTAMVNALGTMAFARLDSANQCPACGSHPVASVVRIGAAEQGLRYLACSLCATEWNLPRIQCIGCGSSKVAYYNIEGGNGEIQAETCADCTGYLKIMHLEKNTALDAVADDLATLSLDILMDEAGYGRYGFNPFLLTAAQ